MADMGRISGAAYPAWIELGLPATTVFVQGHARTRLPRLEGAGGKAERTWLVRFPGELPVKIDVKAYAPAVHAASQSVEIK
jgi:hypothetical protein